MGAKKGRQAEQEEKKKQRQQLPKNSKENCKYLYK